MAWPWRDHAEPGPDACGRDLRPALCKKPLKLLLIVQNRFATGMLAAFLFGHRDPGRYRCRHLLYLLFARALRITEVTKARLQAFRSGPGR